MPDYPRLIRYGEVYAHVQGYEKAVANVSYNLN